MPEHVYELLVRTDGRQSVKTWTGKDGLNASERYADAHPGETVVTSMTTTEGSTATTTHIVSGKKVHCGVRVDSDLRGGISFQFYPRPFRIRDMKFLAESFNGKFALAPRIRRTKMRILVTQRWGYDE